MKPSLLMLPSAVSDSHVHNILPNKIDTDFQFSRASAATRVNHQGLIENVGYFSDELVRNGNFSELGPELITNGNFATDSDWNIGAGWSINNGKAIYQGGTNANLKQTGVLVSGKTHKLVFEVTSNTSNGNLKLAGETVSGGLNVPETVGVHTVYFVNNGTGTNFAFRVTGNTTGVLEIDNVSVKQVDPDDDWTLSTGWAYGSNKVIGSATTSEIQQDVDLPSGKIYKTTFTIEDYVSGAVRIRFRGGSTVDGTPHNGNGTYTEILTSTGHTNIKIDGTSTFTGSVTNISVVEVLGDKPRLDYEPINPTCPHLLLEPQSTNLIDFSENLKDGYTTTNASVDLNNSIAPDGKTTANKFNSTALLSKIQKTYSNSSATSHTISIFLKKGTIDLVAIDILGGIPGIAASTTVNLTTGVITASTSTGSITPIITELQNDWYRITASSTSNGVVANPTISIINKSSVADGYFYMWGLQFEGLSYATSYIPTAGAIETRVAETCNKAGNVNTFNSEEGVVYAEIKALGDDGTNRGLGISDGTVANRVNILFTTSPSTLRGFINTGSVVVADFTSNAFNILEFNKIAIKYKTDDCSFYINGQQIATDTSAAMPSAGTLNESQFDVGAGVLDFYGKVKSLAIYNRALTDTELYTITSTQYSAYSGMMAALGNYTIPC